MQHYCKTQDSTSIYKQQLTQLSSWPNLNLDLPSILQNLGASLVPSLMETTILLNPLSLAMFTDTSVGCVSFQHEHQSGTVQQAGAEED